MFQRNKIPDAVPSTGANVKYELGKGYNLGIGTYYIDVGLADPVNEAIHITWDANVTGTVNYQDSNLPAYKSESGPYHDIDAGVDVALIDTTSGNWIPNAATITTTAGGTASSGTLTIAGGTAGGARWDIVGAARRGRMVIVTSVGGFFRCHFHGKQA